jgi:hypothetical protein
LLDNDKFYVWQGEDACDSCHGRESGAIATRRVAVHDQAGGTSDGVDKDGKDFLDRLKIQCVSLMGAKADEKCVECMCRAKNCSFLVTKKVETSTVRTEASQSELAKLSIILGMLSMQLPDHAGLEHAQQIAGWMEHEVKGGKHRRPPTGDLAL